MIIDEAPYLSHYGRKGMKWGVRRERDLQSMRRVGEGKGSALDVHRSLGRIGQTEMIKDMGLKNAAKKKADIWEKRKKRILAGKATAKDLLLHIGTTRLSDLGPFDR